MSDASVAEPLLTKREVEEAADDEYRSVHHVRPKSPGVPFLSLPFRPTSPPPRLLLVAGLLLVSASSLLVFLNLRLTPRKLPRRVWLRAVEDNHAGLGSVVGQTRLAAALAKAVDATLLVPHDATGHGYSAADYINPAAPVTLDTTSICVLSGRLGRQAVDSLPQDTRHFCDTGELTPSLRRLKLCTLIVDDRPWEYRRDFADCTSDWWDNIVQVPPAPKPASNSKTTVAVHVRWGDTKTRLGFDSATKNATLRSVPLDVAEGVIQKLASCHDLDVHVYMEDGAKDLCPLSHTFTLHDGKDVNPLDELRELASADVRLTATGGFASLIHWSARHGLSIVPVQTNGVTPHYARNKRIEVAYQRDFVQGQYSCADLEAALATS
ncbi:hypothetical protein OF846_005004 [Rhodotorula toruloides]|nr:hypothetical protein OF846_005004 [Rhodotorula toruloides]